MSTANTSHKKVKKEPKHSWWSGVGSFFSGVGCFFSGAVDSIPVVGHIKGAVEYALGHKEAAKKSFEAATRTTVVMGAGVAGFCLGGPAGAVGAGIGAGVLFDAAESGIDSAIHRDWRPHGEMKEFTHIVQGDASWWDYASLGMDIVFDGLSGADGGGAIFKGAIKEGAEKGMAGEIERDLEKKAVEDVAEKGGSSAVSGGTKRPIPEWPPNVRVEYHLREHHWTPRGTGLDEADPMFREIYEELERLPKDDFEVRYGNKEDWLGHEKPWWHYDNTANLKNKTIKSVRGDVHAKKGHIKNCEIRGSQLHKVKKGMPMAERRNVDHALECQLRVKINNGTMTEEFSKTTIEDVSVVLKKWQNSESNLWVINAKMNIWKRDATYSLMARQLPDGTVLRGSKNIQTGSLAPWVYGKYRQIKSYQKYKRRLRNCQISPRPSLTSDGQKLIKKFIMQGKKELLLPLK